MQTAGPATTRRSGRVLVSLAAFGLVVVAVMWFVRRDRPPFEDGRDYRGTVAAAGFPWVDLEGGPQVFVRTRYGDLTCASGAKAEASNFLTGTSVRIRYVFVPPPPATEFRGEAQVIGLDGKVRNVPPPTFLDTDSMVSLDC